MEGIINNAVNRMILKKVIGETLISQPLCPPQITHELTGDW
jgi:hypothetical protein